jgi:hypothetical protein
MLAYLQDLAAIGYGKAKSGVARRFIENAVMATLESKVVPTRRASDFNDDEGED